MEAARTFRLNPRPWRWSRPRVLIEHSNEAAGLQIASALRLAAYAVTLCVGPREPGQCPLTGPDGCAAAEGADLVVSCLGDEREEAREVLHALTTRCTDVQLLVKVPAAAPGEVVAAVRDLLAMDPNGDGADA